MLCSNIRGLKNNLSELKYVIRKRKPIICFLNETHLTAECDSNEIKFNGYKLLHCFSHSKHTGGVSVLIANKIKFSNVAIYEHNFAWFLSIEVIVNKKPIIFAGVYLSASENKQTVLDCFESWYENIAVNKSMVIMGDFNIDMLSNSVYSRRVKKFNADNGLSLFTNKATRIDKDSATLIDLCLSNVNKNKIICNVLDEDQISDHQITEVIVRGKTDKNKRKEQVIMKWENYDPEILWNHIETWIPEWENVKSNSIDYKMNWLLNNLKCSLNQFRKIKEIKQKKDFFDKELEAIRKEKNRLYKCAQYAGTDNKWHEYRVYKNKYKERIQVKKYEQTQYKLNKANGDIKQTWKVIKSLIDNESDDVTQINNGTKLIDDDKEIADEFNKFFVNSIKDLNSAIPNVNLQPDDNNMTDKEFKFKPISIRAIKNCVIELKNNTDEFNLNTKVLLDCMVLIANPLVEIINESFSSGIFPQTLKTSTIIYQFKKLSVHR